MKSIVSAVLLVVVFASGAFGVDEILKHRAVGPALSQSEYESDHAIYLQGGATGAIPFYDALVGYLTGLPIGEEGQMLTVDDGRPAWMGGEWDNTTLDNGVERGPIHHYRMNDTGPVYTVEDSGSFPINLTASVAADVWTTDVAKVGMAFEGGLNQLARSVDYDGAMGGRPLSLCAWVQARNDVPNGVYYVGQLYRVFGGDPGNYGGRHIGAIKTSSSGPIIIRDFYSGLSGYALTWQQWAYIVIVYPASGATKMYVNGALYQTGGTVTGVYTSKIGLLNHGVLPMVVDDARVYDYALSADQVERLYNRGHGTEDNLTTGTVVAAQSVIHDAEARTYVATQLTSDPATIYFAAGGATVGTWSSDTLHVAGNLTVDGTFDTDLAVDYADAAGTADYATQAGAVVEIKDRLRHADQSSTLSIQDTTSGYDELRWTTGNGLQFTVDRLFGAILRVPGIINLAAVAAGQGLEIQAQRASSYSQFLWDAYEAKLTLRQHDTATTDVLEARGNATVTGNATVGGTLGITGDLTAPNVYTKTQVDASVGLRVPYSGASGNVALGANDLSGRNASFTGTLGATGAATLGGALSVAGNATVTGQLISDSIKDVSDQGLVLALGMDSRSISGTTLLDSSTYGNNGTVTGATHVATGGPNGGGYYSFDGTLQYINIADKDEFDLGTGSISIWVQCPSIPSSGERTIISKEGVNSGWRLSQTTDGNIMFVSSAASGVVSIMIIPSAYIPLSTWAHIVAVNNGTNTYIYCNGLLRHTATLTAVPVPNAINVCVGAYSVGYINKFVGSIAQPRIFNRALSAAEIKALYDSRASIRPPKLALYSNTTQNVYSPVWFSGDVSALSFTDRTPGWDKSPDAALAAIVATGSKTITIGKGKDIKTKAEIDHDTLPIEAQVVLGVDKATSEVIHGRDLGMMITIQSEAIKALEARLKKLEGEKGVQK